MPVLPLKEQYIEESNQTDSSPDTVTDTVHVTITQSSKQLSTSGVHVPSAPNSDNSKYTQPVTCVTEKLPMQTSVPACTSTCVDHHSLQPSNPILKHKTQNKSPEQNMYKYLLMHKYLLTYKYFLTYKYLLMYGQ